MKVRAVGEAAVRSVRVVRRRGRVYVVCATNPKHKQRQGFHTETVDGPSLSFPRPHSFLSPFSRSPSSHCSTATTTIHLPLTPRSSLRASPPPPSSPPNVIKEMF
ncbi:unnamed protein product [Closterium sp. NIES-64]|nr:unnamed protein product [Closterium sp. NIES-64]